MHECPARLRVRGGGAHELMRRRPAARGEVIHTESILLPTLVRPYLSHRYDGMHSWRTAADFGGINGQCCLVSLARSLLANAQSLTHISCSCPSAELLLRRSSDLRACAIAHALHAALSHPPTYRFTSLLTVRGGYGCAPHCRTWAVELAATQGWRLTLIALSLTEDWCHREA